MLLPWGARGLGQWLVVADPMEPVRAIVVLSGRAPFRAIGAAAIYRAGWAPEIWLTAEARTPEEVALDRLRIQVVRGEVYKREVLQRLGVPARAIRVLSGGVGNTVDEVRPVARELGAGGADRVILVTSKIHGRRVHATWSAVAGSTPCPIAHRAPCLESPPRRGSPQDDFPIAVGLTGAGRVGTVPKAEFGAGIFPGCAGGSSIRVWNDHKS